MTTADIPGPRWSVVALLAATCLVLPSLASAQQTGAPLYEGTVKQAPASDAAGKSDPAKTDTAKQGAGGTSTKAETRSPEDRVQADRQAFFDARIAALHAGLTLTADQEPLWAPVETAIRAFAKTGGGRHSREQVSSLLHEAPSDLVRMRSEQLIARGEAMKKLVDATGPLMDKLDEAQKDRLPLLLQGLRPSRILRAAFDIRYGEVVNDPDDDGSKSGRSRSEDGDDGAARHHQSRMRDDDSGYGTPRGNPMPRHRGDDQDGDDRS